MIRYLLVVDDIQIEDLTDADLQRIRDCCDAILDGGDPPESKYIEVVSYAGEGI